MAIFQTTLTGAATSIDDEEMLAIASTGTARGTATRTATGGIGAFSALVVVIIGAVAFARYKSKHGKYSALSAFDSQNGAHALSENLITEGTPLLDHEHGHGPDGEAGGDSGQRSPPAPPTSVLV